MQRALILWGLLIAGGPAWAESQPLPDIALEPPIECWYHSDFPTLKARMDPSAEIVNSRLYFRCSLFQDYYFVDLESEDGMFTGVAPQAEESCPQVLYYVEAVTRDFTSARTPERIADVTSVSECRRRFPTAAFFPGSDPQIVVGSTVAGPELAPGFKSLGVSAFMSATGIVAAASSSGGSTALIAGVAAAAGAAVGVGVLVADGSSSSTPPPPAPGVPPTVVTPPPVTGPPPTPTPTAEVKACVRFEPVDAIVDVNQPLTIDGRCSEGGENLAFRIDLGDGRIREGQSFVTVVYANPGTYSLTLTVERPEATVIGARLADEDTIRRTVRVLDPITAPVPAFDVYNLEPDTCLTEFNASATTGDVREYLWDLDVNNDFGEGVIHASGRVTRYEWDGGCFGNTQGRTTVRLTVVGLDGARTSLTREVNVLRSRRLQPLSTTMTTSVSTHLWNADGARAQIVLGSGQVQPVAGGVPSVHSHKGSVGTNTLEGVLLTPLAAPALWRFDFSASAHFVPGSLRLVTGVEVSRDARSIVVRVSGGAGERVRIHYELAR